MSKQDIVALVAGVALVLTVAADFTVRFSSAPEPQAVERTAPAAGEAGLPSVPDPAALERIDAGYLSEWENSPTNLVTMLEIDDNHILCYRNVWAKRTARQSAGGASLEDIVGEYGYRNDCMIKEKNTGRASLILSTEGQVFGRDLGGGEFGLIADDDMLVFSRATLQPVRLESAPALEPSDLLSPQFMTEWFAAGEVRGHPYKRGKVGVYELYSTVVEEWNSDTAIGKMSDCVLFYLLDSQTNNYTPLFTVSDGSLYLSAGPLADGRFAIQSQQGWVLTLDPDTARPVALYRGLIDTNEEIWYPIGICAYRDGYAELGAVARANNVRVYGVALYDAHGKLLRRVETTLDVDADHYFDENAPELHIYGEHMLFNTAKRRPAGPVSISLADGAVEKLGGDYQTWFGADAAVSIRSQRHSVEGGEDREYDTELTVYVWRDGRLTEPVTFIAPMRIDPFDGTGAGAIQDAVYDTENRRLALYQLGRRHTVELATLAVTTEDYFPGDPDRIYARTDDGRYTIGSIYLGGGGDGHVEELYRIDHVTGEARSLMIVGGGYGYWGMVNVIGGQVAVTNGGTSFFDLETCERLPLYLPAGEEEHTLGVVYDRNTGLYLRASSPNAWFVDPEKVETFTVRVDCYEQAGPPRQSWQTDVKPGYEKFAAPAPIHLTMYGGRAIFLEYTEQPYYGSLPASIARLDPSTGEVTRMEGNFLYAANGFLFTVVYGFEESGHRISSFTLRKYEGDRLLDEQTVQLDRTQSSALDYMEYDAQSGRLTGGYTLDGRRQLFDAAFAA